MLPLTELIEWARQNRGSDIHLVRGLPPRVRVDGSLKSVPDTTPLRKWKQIFTTAV